MKAYDQADPQTGLRTFRFLNGLLVQAPAGACRGCILEDEAFDSPDEIRPVYQDASIAVRQDAEWPVPGFYVVGLRQHVGSFDQIELDTHLRMARVLRAVRKALRQLGANRVHLVQEEKHVGAHLHYWLLPLWEEVLVRQGINPRLYESNILEYLGHFEYQAERERITQFNDRVRGLIPELIDT